VTPADRLEAERYSHVVREWKPPPPSRDYTDLLAIADVEARARDEQERHTA
jgi:hypothetical protein